MGRSEVTFSFVINTKTVLYLTFLRVRKDQPLATRNLSTEAQRRKRIWNRYENEFWRLELVRTCSQRK